MKKYVENMKEYEEICRYIEFGTPISIWALWDRKIPSTALEKFHTRASSQALGFNLTNHGLRAAF